MIAWVPGTDPIFQSRRKAISALFPYAVRLAQGGQQGMIGTIVHIASKLPYGEFIWDRIFPSITFLFDDSSPPSLDQATVFAAPYANWNWKSYPQSAVSRWAAAVLAIPYSEAVGQSVVDTLLQIASNDSLRPHIPVEIWAWLKRRPSLPPVCQGRSCGKTGTIVDHIRGLGDIEILKSYFLLIWSEWDDIMFSGVDAMEISIREKFCGIEMWRHRNDLTERLDYVLEQLGRGVEHLKQHHPRISEDYISDMEWKYKQLKEVLAEVDKDAMKVLSHALSGILSNLIHFNEDANGCVQNITRPSFVPYLSLVLDSILAPGSD